METVALWHKIKEMGDFTKSQYDEGLLAELRQALSISAKANFEKELETIPPETFLAAFFTIVAPLTAMYTDILNLYRRCGAKSNTNNIEIHFDIDKFDTANFSAAHFIHARGKLVQIRQAVDKVQITRTVVDSLWFLVERNYHLNDMLDNIQDKAFRAWRKEYFENLDQWPSGVLDFESASKDSPIREPLAKVFVLWEQLFAYYRSLAATRREFRDTQPNHALDPLDVMMHERDYCLVSSLANLYFLAESYPVLPPDEKDAVDTGLAELLGQLTYETTESYIDKTVTLWEDFLRLPVWDKRHEVYSIWVFTLMTARFADASLTFHVKDSVLHFPFKSTCIATATLGNKAYDFWTELRTSTITAPVGGSRTGAIQPDYSIVCQGADHVQNSVVVVECKQYQKPSYKNFADAILDYANNRPNATVFLVNNGKTSQVTLQKRLPLLPKERYGLFALCRPGTPTGLALPNTIYDLVCKHAGLNMLDNNCTAKFLLHWGNEPRDLDFHLFFCPAHGGPMGEVCYSGNGIEHVEYGDDKQNGFGPEKLEVHKWMEGTYDVWVHNYSGEAPLTKSGAFVDARFIGAEPNSFHFNCPVKGSGRWWHILTIDTVAHTIIPHDAYSETGPH